MLPKARWTNGSLAHQAPRCPHRVVAVRRPALIRGDGRLDDRRAGHPLRAALWRSRPVVEPVLRLETLVLPGTVEPPRRRRREPGAPGSRRWTVVKRADGSVRLVQRAVRPVGQLVAAAPEDERRMVPAATRPLPRRRGARRSPGHPRARSRGPSSTNSCQTMIDAFVEVAAFDETAAPDTQQVDARPGREMEQVAQLLARGPYSTSMAHTRRR